LALTIFKTSARVSLVMANSQHLGYSNEAYIQQFGPELGVILYSEISQALKACVDTSITINTIRLAICTVIWKHFGVRWLDIFSCIKESRKETPDEGVDVLAVLLSTGIHEMIIC
jgi:hypothetical protein